MVSVITVIITVIVDALSFVERYPALTCSADMLRHADCSAGMTWHVGMLSTEDPNNARTNWNAEIWALSFSHVLSTASKKEFQPTTEPS